MKREDDTKEEALNGELVFAEEEEEEAVREVVEEQGREEKVEKLIGAEGSKDETRRGEEEEAEEVESCRLREAGRVLSVSVPPSTLMDRSKGSCCGSRDRSSSHPLTDPGAQVLQGSSPWGVGS